MAVKTFTVRNPVDGSFDTYHLDSALPQPQPGNAVFAADTGNGTTHGKKDSHRDSDRATAEGR
jgi:hypothetical protein